jgi:hypothetical protein
MTADEALTSFLEELVGRHAELLDRAFLHLREVGRASFAEIYRHATGQSPVFGGTLPELWGLLERDPRFVFDPTTFLWCIA